MSLEANLSNMNKFFNYNPEVNLSTLETGDVIDYVVHNENTLGYLYKVGESLMISVLGAKISKGGRNWMNGPYFAPYLDTPDTLRKATQEDFETFRVSSKGHL